ncbi:MAG: hypothetical protein KF889_07905 [Alphaproteobacteria bacterium]|nr:hypothetical protein [Alphaproteobacteria bacterium]MCW5740743.1 hypothetical protein [Alphaproteobacteria bacterium]
MNFPRMQAIIACALLFAGIFSIPASAYAQGAIATWNCPKRLAHARATTPSPAPAQYQAVQELERYVAQLQAELAKSERLRSKRARSSR